MANETVEQLLADSRLAFLNQRNEAALSLSRQAISLEPGNAEAYRCAANACMSLERYDEAIKNYAAAVNRDPANGNRYYDLGFAQATAEKLADAMKNLSRAEELGCTPENLVQLYSLMGIICFDVGRYGDALINLSKAEQLTGVDLDILKRKTVIYGLRGDIPAGLRTTNQIKMFAPSEYAGYSMAFRLLMQAGRLEEARRELGRAARYTSPCMDQYFDRMSYELEMHVRDPSGEHLAGALAVLDRGLKTVLPSPEEAMECYLEAAEINMRLENGNQALACLNAARSPAGAFNSGFQVSGETFGMSVLTELDLEGMMESDRERLTGLLGEAGLEDPVLGGPAPDWLTDTGEEEAPPPPPRRLDASAPLAVPEETADRMNMLYAGAYTLLGDFTRVIGFARKLRASSNRHNSHVGMYTEANALRELGSPLAGAAYDEAVRHFRRAMIQDPADVTAVTMRVQCHIDTGDFGAAEQVCALLSKEIREPLLEKIRMAKGGEGTLGAKD